MHRARPDAGGIDLLVRQDRHDARRRPCGRDVDRPDARMRVRRAHERAVRLVRLRRVLDEAAEPADQRVVLDARLEVMIVRNVSFTETSLHPGCQS